MTAAQAETYNNFREKIDFALESGAQTDCMLYCATLIVYMNELKENKEISYKEFRQTLDYCADTYRTLFGI